MPWIANSVHRFHAVMSYGYCGSLSLLIFSVFGPKKSLLKCSVDASAGSSQHTQPNQKFQPSLPRPCQECVLSFQPQRTHVIICRPKAYGAYCRNDGRGINLSLSCNPSSHSNETELTHKRMMDVSTV